MKFSNVNVLIILIICVGSTAFAAVSQEKVPSDVSDELSSKVPDELSSKVPDELPIKVPDELSTKVPDELPIKVPDELSTKVPDELSTKVPDELPIKVPDELSSKVPDEESTEASFEVVGGDVISPLCGAAGSCHGVGGGQLCHDRCRQCSGPSGRYCRGECCGLAWQTCCCYYSC